MWGHAPLCGCSLCSCLPRVFHLIASEIARCGYDDYVDFAARQLRQVEAKRQELRHQLLPQQGRNQRPPNPRADTSGADHQGAATSTSSSSSCWSTSWSHLHSQKRSRRQQNTPRSEHFWKLRCSKSARRCGAKHMSKSKCTKHTMFRALWKFRCRAHFEVKMYKAHHSHSPFWSQDAVLCGRRKGCCTLPKVSQTWGFVAFPKTMAGVGHLKGICKDAFRVAGAVQETCSSEMLGGQGADFMRRVAFWSIGSSGLLRWFCVTGAALRTTWPHFFVASTVL